MYIKLHNVKAYPSLPLISLTKLQFYHSIKTLSELVHIYHKVGNGDGLKTYLPVVFVYTMVLSLYISLVISLISYASLWNILQALLDIT